jgi:hypothetical protein
MASRLNKKVDEIEKFIREKCDVDDYLVKYHKENSDDNLFFFSYMRIVDDIKKTVRRRHAD